MLFDSPQWLWGTALALLVPIIHLLGQRSIKPIPIPSLMWLDKFKTQDRRRNKLKEWLLVLLRMLVIALFFFSLASPRIPRDSTTILIDNSPALWSRKAYWLPEALKQLPKGTYTVNVRGGIGIGTLRADEVVEALKDWPASEAPLQDYENSYILSAGYSVLPEGASTYVLPKRSSVFNALVKEVRANAKEQWFTITNGTHSGEWEVRDSNTLILQEADSIVRVPWWSIEAEELVLSYSGDSIIEDNNHLLYRPNSLPIIELITLGAPGLASLPIQNKVVYRNTGDLQKLPTSAILVLNGFSFVPEELKNEGYVLLRFSNEQTAVLDQEVIPVLDDPFYTDFFIGASERNRWPSPKKWSGEAFNGLTPFLKTKRDVVLSGWRKLPDGAVLYEQSFPIADAGHPYYKALLQWASEQQQEGMRSSLVNYGEDGYDSNITQLDQTKVQYYSWVKSVKEVQKSVQFWTESKIALALALFCALIALIFAKI
ncbi:BatA domain-containing protein [Schleiferiaceae bacterium]|nr:BatA domain-containing protein [Schleiferiaceae bacterium]